MPDRTQKVSQPQRQLFHATVSQVTTQTVGNRPHVAQLLARRPNIVLPLNASHRQLREVWCRLRQKWTLAQWSNVVFSDESKFVLDFHDGRQRVWSRTWERYQPRAMIAHDSYGGGSVMSRRTLTPHLPEECYWGLLQRQCH